MARLDRLGFGRTLTNSGGEFTVFDDFRGYVVIVDTVGIRIDAGETAIAAIVVGVVDAT